MIDKFQDAVSGTLRVMSTGLKIPVMVLLVLLAALTVFILGTLIVEIITEHRHLKVQMPALIDRIRAAGAGKAAGIISESSLLIRQKDALIELTKHPDLTPMMRESLAIRLIAQEKDFYDGRTKRTDLIAKVGPMLGLMGTLIPLGPGIIALGQGDTYTLSTSLLMAFDTTVAGLACAAVALVISTVRKRWYKNYMSMLETLMECTLEMENMRGESSQAPVIPSQEAAPAAAVQQPQTQVLPQLEQQEPQMRQTPDEQRKQAMIEAYKAAYVEAVKAGYGEAEAKEFARQNMTQVLSQWKQYEGQKAGEQL